MKKYLLFLLLSSFTQMFAVNYEFINNTNKTVQICPYVEGSASGCVRIMPNSRDTFFVENGNVLRNIGIWDAKSGLNYRWIEMHRVGDQTFTITLDRRGEFIVAPSN